MSAEARLAILQGRIGAGQTLARSERAATRRGVALLGRGPSITRCRAMIAVGSPGKTRASGGAARGARRGQRGPSQHLPADQDPDPAGHGLRQAGQDGRGPRNPRAGRDHGPQGNLVFPFVELGTPMVDLLDQLTGEGEFTAQVERLVIAFGAPTTRSDARDAGAGKPPMPGTRGAARGGRTKPRRPDPTASWTSSSCSPGASRTRRSRPAWGSRPRR